MGGWRWLDRNCFDLGRQMRLSYLPPLMVYMAAGVSSLTAIVGTFFVKEYLGLSAQFLAALGFWVMLPWALKVPIGHLVDLIWRHKAGLVYLGAALIASSLLIMIGLLADPAAMRGVMPAGSWYVLAALLAPVGYVLQDCVADAMTVEAVPRVDAGGQPLSDEQRRIGHTTMQTLGRVAIIGGAVLVSLANIILFTGVEAMTTVQKAQKYQQIYTLALIIPVMSVAGVLFAGFLRRRAARRLASQGYSRTEIEKLVHGADQRPPVNWWVLGGGLIFAAFSVSVGLIQIPYGQEIIFAGSLAIVIFLMWRLVGELESSARITLVGTAMLIFVFRAMPNTGEGTNWWAIDVLGFDQQFLSVLTFTGTMLTLVGMFVFRRFIAEHSIVYIVGLLTIVGAVLSLPNIAMFYGLHEWTAAHTGGVVDARFIALVNTALESPLGQIAMIPMLAWIANSAPERLKATYFAVMASFTNLALALSQLLTKYVNQVFVVTREVKDPVTAAIQIPADYSQMGYLLIAVTLIGLVVPLLAILVVKTTRFRSV
jgi:BT1 family